MNKLTLNEPATTNNKHQRLELFNNCGKCRLNMSTIQSDLYMYHCIIPRTIFLFPNLITKRKENRMHSSRMHTGCSLTVCRSLLVGRGSAPWGVGLLLGGAWSWGGLVPGGPAPGGGVVSQHALRQTPTVNRMTDRCKNINFIAAGKNFRFRVRFCAV